MLPSSLLFPLNKSILKHCCSNLDQEVFGRNQFSNLYFLLYHSISSMSLQLLSHSKYFFYMKCDISLYQSFMHIKMEILYNSKLLFNIMCSLNVEAIINQNVSISKDLWYRCKIMR